MESRNAIMTLVTYGDIIATIKLCAKKRDLYRGTRLHADMVKRGLLERNPYLASSLINMYIKCGAMAKAEWVHEHLPSRNVISWSILIAGHVQQGQGREALNCFQKMKSDGFPPDAVTYTCILKACASTGAIELGKRVHEEVVNRGLLEKDIHLGNALISMYAKCNMLSTAQQVFEDLPLRNVVSWSALITGYTQQGQSRDALNCFKEMEKEGISPDVVCFTCILKACSISRALDMGRRIHDKIVSLDLLEKHIVLANSLVDMYTKCGLLVKAQHLVADIPWRDQTSWNTLIAGYVQHGKGHEALNCFEQMQTEGLFPDAVTFICILKACGCIGAINRGLKIHEEIANMGLMEKDVVLGTALLDMYSKCGMLTRAKQVFDELPARNVVTWSALITGYVQHEQHYDAVNCFEQMQCEGLFPDTVIFICILKACGCIRDVKKGEQIHDKIVKSRMLHTDIVLCSSLVDMYVKCGALAKAHRVLQEAPVRDLLAWNSLIAGYAHHEDVNEALYCFEQMQIDNIRPNIVTFICLLRACAIAGALDKGEKIHENFLTGGFLYKDIMLGTALVDMYVKCGSLVKAQQVLEELPVRNIVSWNALIAGYSHKGQGYEAISCFRQMQNEGLPPNKVTFLCLLAACCHSGLLEEAEILFKSMTEEYTFFPGLEHYTCMVVAFGSEGDFDKVMSIIMESYDYVETWLALLGACRQWRNVKLGRLAFNQTMQLDGGCSAAYVLIANIFADAGFQEDADKVEVLRLKYAV